MDFSAEISFNLSVYAENFGETGILTVEKEKEKNVSQIQFFVHHLSSIFDQAP